MAGPKRPQDRVELPDVKKNFHDAFADGAKKQRRHVADRRRDEPTVQNGAVVIAAITSCTNTSNPSVMLAAGLLAKKAVERGLTVKPWVKTSLAPGSKVVTDYYRRSGPDALPRSSLISTWWVTAAPPASATAARCRSAVAEAVQKENLVVAAVLSGNRNFEGRINPLVKANYLASPPLVVAYALAGTRGYRFGTTNRSARTPTAQPVYLRDIWPIRRGGPGRPSAGACARRCSQHEYDAASSMATTTGRRMPVPAGGTYAWDEQSTYIKKPPYFDHMVDPSTPIADLRGMRVLALLGDSVTTDHISPAGSIPKDSPAGRYLIAQGVQPRDFNSYGARRGNHEVMVRGTLANIRLRNQLAPGTEGGWTRPPAGRRADVHLRRRHALPAGRRAAADPGGQGVRLGLVARLGGEGRDAAGREGGDRRELRAHPPHQPGGHGRAAAAVRAGRDAASLSLRARKCSTSRACATRWQGGGRKAAVRAVAERHGEDVRSGCAGGHAAGGRILPQRRHPAVCAAAAR